MVNQAFRIKIAYRSEKEEEEKKENTRDGSVPDGSDNKNLTWECKLLRLSIFWKCRVGPTTRSVLTPQTTVIKNVLRSRNVTSFHMTVPGHMINWETWKEQVETMYTLLSSPVFIVPFIWIILTCFCD